MKTFSKRMRRRAQNVERNVDQMTRQTALAIHATVVMATPVDTGRARSNWHIGLGAPPDAGNEEPFVPGGEGGSNGAANAQMSIAAAKAAVSDRRPGQAIFISNNLPYIGRLNEGWSAQAPAGFVEKAVANGVETVRGMGLRLTEDPGK